MAALGVMEIGTTTTLQDLPHHVRTVATAIAVLGRTEPDLVAALAGLSVHSVTDAIGVLEREHVPRREPLDGMPPEQLAGLRVRAAVVLQDSGRPAGEVARQLVGLDRIEPWMSRVLVAAATGHGPARAKSAYLTRALDGAPASLPLRVRLATELARTDPTAAVPVLSDVYTHATDPALRVRIAVMFALTSRVCGQPSQARDHLRHAAKELDAAPPRPDLDDLRAYLDAALLAISLADPPTAAPVATIGEPAGRTTAERCLLAMRADSTMRAGGPLDHAVRQARLAVSDPDHVDDWSTPAAALVLRCAGRFGEATDVLDRAVAYFAERGDELGECRLLTHRARVLIATGDLCLAERDAMCAFTIAARNSWLPHEPRTALVLALAKARLGQADAAARLVDGVGHTDEYRYGVHYAMAWVHMARRNWQAAIDDLFTCGRAMADSGLHNPVLVTWWADAAILATVLADQPARAAEALEHGVDLARQWRTPEYTALVTMLEGLVTPGKTALLAEAVERFAVLPTRLWHAFAEFLLGRALVAAGDHRAARPHLHAAIDLALKHAHEQWVPAAHRLLRQAGGRMRVRPPAEHDVLTASERRVVEMAVEGAANREIAETLFVSLRTVELHLTRAYRKLGVSGRAQLREAM
jgi:DNA-binding CsgD family transcriptional regulator